MHLVQIILPLYANSGDKLPRDRFDAVKRELVAQFGGVTAYSRSPAEGLWEAGAGVTRDEVLLYEVMVDALDRAWWNGYRQLLESRRLVEVYGSDGRAAADDRTRIRLSAQVVARRDDRVETGTDTRGGHAGFELLEDDPEQVAENAARRALTLLDAVDAPSGRLPVVVGNGFGGVLLHEAVGHGLEADAIQKGASVYAGRIGEQLAPDFVTAYDDGSRRNEWGSDGIDDEGTPTRRTTILEDGRLTSYLYDLLRARRDGVESTGNGRRESFRHLPVPRMTNTFFAPGEATPEELIGGVERGLYAVSFGGGQVEPATGDFVFGVSEGYLIEGGRVTSPVRGATLVGNGIEALGAIDGIANDLDIATGYCGKAGQSVAAGVGQPHVRLRELTVGGTGS